MAQHCGENAAGSTSLDFASAVRTDHSILSAELLQAKRPGVVARRGAAASQGKNGGRFLPHNPFSEESSSEMVICLVSATLLFNDLHLVPPSCSRASDDIQCPYFVPGPSHSSRPNRYVTRLIFRTCANLSAP